ncbi:MAG: hypothetical protein K0R57_6254 [Paenibacillaceae bacterium]|nr:hypothetical protein [Paenibacillaceae bacterium]
MNKSLWLKIGRVALPVCLILAGVFFIFFTDSGKELTHMNVEEMSEYLRSFGAYSIILGMAAVFVQVIVPFIPFVLVAGANVLVFGLFWGLVINYTMAVLGSFAAFMFARYFGHDRVESGLAKYATVRIFNKRMEEQGLFYVLIGRFIPVIPSTAVSLGAGVTKVRIRDFILGTVIGKLPVILLESFIGHDLIHFHQYKGRLALLGLIFVTLLLLGAVFKNKLTGKTVE